MEFSQYQKAIFEWVQAHVETKGALIVEAVAGSGKTTTIVEAANLIPTDHKAVFLAFNKKISVELGEKLPSHIESKTMNALGWALLRRRLNLDFNAIDANKTRILIDKHLNDDAQKVKPELASLIAKAKAYGLVPYGMDIHAPGTYIATRERWTMLMEKFDIDSGCIEEGEFLLWADAILQHGITDTSIVDFDDQLYLPVALDLGAWRYDWIIVDEAQDVSHVQRQLLKMFLKSNGRIIAVGDRHQAIYGFRGADSSSMDNIAKVFKAEQLDLSICYRCPKSVVEIAKQYVPQIEAADDAAEGQVLHPTSFSVADFTEEDLVVCRNTAPLIELAYRCIGEGFPVHVMGRDIGKGLINLIKKVAGKRTTDMERFVERLIEWQERENRKAKDDEAKQAAIGDKVNSIEAIRRASEAATVKELISAVERIFSDQGKGVTLATVHKAKGMEANRVFILEPQLMPSKWARQQWQIEQEANIIYVAVTRALETLVYLPLDIVE